MSRTHASSTHLSRRPFRRLFRRLLRRSFPQRGFFSRTLVAVVAAQLLLSGCSAMARPQGQWPEPEPQAWESQRSPQQYPPVVRSVPNFRAPSATHCARPVTTREVPGGSVDAQYPHLRGDTRARRDAEPAREALAKSEAAAGSATGAGSLSAPAAPAAARAESKAFADNTDRAMPRPPTFAPPQYAPMPQPLAQPQRRSQAVTAGMVDDNADFDSYLAFRARTHVSHRPRDIRERYLLEVKDSRGRGIADAEVAVQAASGYSMWARTDAGGRVWLHPNAFDPSLSPQYDIAVRKGGRLSWGQLVRGQKSAVEVRLDARAVPEQARLDLVFLIDATGSMGDEIDKLKASLRTIVADVARLPSHPDLCLGMVAYRDHGDAFVTRTHDFSDDVGGFLSDALIPLQADGGGDYPEAMNEALHEAVHGLSWRGDGATRMVILIADAPPHLNYGAPHYDDDMVAALGKGIKIFSVGASGLDRQGEFIQRQMAQYTGGKFVFLTYANAHAPSSGPGRETTHDVRNYSVDTLDRLIVRLVTEELGKLAS